MAHARGKIVSENVGGERYDYYPLGEHVVSAIGVCGGRPTFKYTRIDIQHALELLSSGRTVQQVAASYRVPVPAVQEALQLAIEALEKQAG